MTYVKYLKMKKIIVLGVLASAPAIFCIWSFVSQYLLKNRKVSIYDFSKIKGRPSWVPEDAFVVDLHFHSNASSDGRMTPLQIIQWCKANGYNGVALTDHNSVANHQEMVSVAKEIDPDFVIIPAFEWTTARFHANVYGTTSYSKGKSYLQWPSIKDIIKTGDEARSKGGFIQYNHPKDISSFGLSGGEVLAAKFDAVEIISGPYDLRNRTDIIDFCSKNGLAMTGGSDTHIPGHYQRVYVEILSDDHTVPGILSAIREGKTRIYSQRDRDEYREPSGGFMSVLMTVLTDIVRFPLKQATKLVLPVRKFP